MALIPHIVIEQGHTHILKYYTLLVYVVVAMNSTHTKVVHTTSIHGSGHKQYTY